MQLRVVDARTLATTAATEDAGEKGSQAMALHLLEAAAIGSVPEARPAGWGVGGGGACSRWLGGSSGPAGSPA